MIRKIRDCEKWMGTCLLRSWDLLWTVGGHYVRGLLLFLLVVATGCSNRDMESTDLVLESGLKLETVVSEPLVIDPVAFAYDEQGYLYVVEDRGYPDPAEGGQPDVKEGRVARLEDTDGDGRYDYRSEFGTGFTYPNGILAWRGGVFVTVAPDIVYLKDTDGDGIADLRQVVLTGFKDTKTSQLRMSHPTLGPDGWVYVTSGLNGGSVHSPLYPDRPAVTFNGSDIRFNPHTFEVEVAGGRSQFGMSFDAYGRRFGVTNRHPVQHIVMDPADLGRNPNLSFNETVHNVSKVEEEAVVFPLSNAATSSDYIPKLMGQSHGGTFTAASGVFIYSGKGLTPAHQGDVFICESAQNLVQRQKVYPDGVTFSSEVAHEGKEFLASANEWFRPVFLGVGPEDGLHVVDMHRKVIDHPSYVPEGIREKLDFQSGKDMGRIYKISDKSKSLSLAGKKWIQDSTPLGEIVQMLESDKQWDRATAHRLLLEREDPAAVPALRELVIHSNRPQSRVRALWLLHTLKGLDTHILKQAIRDEEAGVREQGVLLSRQIMNADGSLKHAVLSTCRDADMRVRFNCALVLGDLQGPGKARALATLAVQDGDSKWMRAAILSGIGQQTGAFLTELWKQKPVEDSEPYSIVMKETARILGSGGSKKEIRDFVETTLHGSEQSLWRISAMLGLMEGLAGHRGFQPTEDGLLTYVYGVDIPGSVNSSWDRYSDNIIATAASENGKQSTRVKAIELMGFLKTDETLPVFNKTLQPESPPAVQQAVVRAVGRQGSRAGARLLLDDERWAGYTPAVRSAVLSELLSKSVFIEELLHAIDNNIVAPFEISSVDRQRLMNRQDESIPERAETLFAELEGGARREVYEEYLEIIAGKGNREVGASAFERTCSVCHSYDGEGGNVGPDLTGIKNQPKDAILLHTIIPNYEVYPSYQSVVIQTRDKRSISGWIVSESDHSVTILTASGNDETISRSNITSLSNTGKSLMPDGLEQTMTREEMAGLIEYLKSGSEF